MRPVMSATARIAVLCTIVVISGCGGPETGSQVKVTDEEIQKRSQGIKDAMKSGMYYNPARKPAKSK